MNIKWEWIRHIKKTSLRLKTLTQTILFNIEQIGVPSPLSVIVDQTMIIRSTGDHGLIDQDTRILARTQVTIVFDTVVQTALPAVITRHKRGQDEDGNVDENCLHFG